MIQDPWVKEFDTINRELVKLTVATVIVDSCSYGDVHQKELLMGNNKSDSYDNRLLTLSTFKKAQLTRAREHASPLWRKAIAVPAPGLDYTFPQTFAAKRKLLYPA